MYQKEPTNNISTKVNQGGTRA